jgi:hypothetical protein
VSLDYRVEYAWLSFRGGPTLDAPETLERLNALGRDGWLLCSRLSEDVGRSRDDPVEPTWEGLFARPTKLDEEQLATGAKAEGTRAERADSERVIASDVIVKHFKPVVEGI